MYHKLKKDMVQEDFKNENDLLRHIMTVDKNVEQGRALKKIFTTPVELVVVKVRS